MLTAVLLPEALPLAAQWGAVGGARQPSGRSAGRLRRRRRSGPFRVHLRTPVGVPFEARLRFQPTDLVVPVGGHLRLTIAGSVSVNPGLSQVGIPEPVFMGPSQRPAPT